MYPSYLGANERRELDVAFERIAEAILQERADFLLGAGMSKESGVPVGCELAVQLLRRFFPSTGSDAPTDEQLKSLSVSLPFEAIVKAIELGAGKGRDDLTLYLRGILVDSAFNPSQAHHDLVAISAWDGSPKLSRLFTTNFDPLLDKSFGDRAIPITEANTREIAVAQGNGQIPIIYLHGRLDGGQYQITESDVFGTRFKAVDSQFRSALNEADAFVFVGYSMNDPDFRRIYMDFREDIEVRGANDKKTYVVSLAGDPNYFALSKHIWLSRGAVFLPMTAGEFFQNLRQVLERNFDRDAKAKIMKKYNITDEDAFLDKLRRTAELLNISEPDAVRFLLEARTKTGVTK
jgi:hypothetical protein